MRIISVILSIIFLTGCSTDVPKEKEDKEEEMTYKIISGEEAQKIMEREEGYVILDVRTPEEFAQEHIKGAINIPNETIKAGEMPKELPYKQQLILIYCRSGNRSKQAAEKLINSGYTNIVEFGGLIDWTGETE